MDQIFTHLFTQFSIIEVFSKFLTLKQIYNLSLVSKQFCAIFSERLQKNQSILTKWHCTEQMLKKLSINQQFLSQDFKSLKIHWDKVTSFPQIGLFVFFASPVIYESPTHMVLSSNHRKESIWVPIPSNYDLNFRTIDQLNVEHFLKTGDINSIFKKIDNNFVSFYQENISNCGQYSFKFKSNDNFILTPLMHCDKYCQKIIPIPSTISKEYQNFSVERIRGDVHKDRKLISLSVTYSWWMREKRLVCFLLRLINDEYQWETRNRIQLLDSDWEIFDVFCDAIYCPLENRFEILTIGHKTCNAR